MKWPFRQVAPAGDSTGVCVRHLHLGQHIHLLKQSNQVLRQKLFAPEKFSPVLCFNLGSMAEGYDDFSGLLEELNIGMSESVRTNVKAQGSTQLTGKSRRRDKSDRATIETVLDPRTFRVRDVLPAAEAVSLALRLVANKFATSGSDFD